MSGMTEGDAIQQLSRDYVKTFGNQPRMAEAILISASASRVIRGEWYRWRKDGPLKKLEWNPVDD